MDFLDSLNPQQQAAVAHVNGPLLLLAGAGSGKTRVITHRIAHLVRAHGVPGPCVLAVTFTNKAAAEMRQRVRNLLNDPPASESPLVSTFHSFCVRLLRRDGKSLAELRQGFTPSFTIYDDDDQMSLLRSIYRQLGITDEAVQYRAALSWISGQKSKKQSPQDAYAAATDQRTSRLAAIFERYEEGLRRSNALDFDDLLHEAVRLLAHDTDLRLRLNRRHEFLMIDEYQDTNHSQYELMRLLSAEHRNVCVVGDEDQSIYGWRGADIRNILDFEKDFPAARVVRLEENYRSTPQVLEVANVVISANTSRRGKTLRATRGAGETVTLVGSLDERDEAEFVTTELLSRRAADETLSLRDIAVLYRTNAQSRSLEEAFRLRAIPYRLVGAVRFYDRREIRDLVSYLKLIANPADDEAFRRAVAVPKRGLGETTIEQLAERARTAGIPLLAAAARPDLQEGLRPAARTALHGFAALITRHRERAADSAVDELLLRLIEDIRFEDVLRAEGKEGLDRLDNVRELITGAAETVIDEGGELGLTPLDHFLQRAMLVTDFDRQSADADAVTLMTLHNAKGLEFPLVFITGLEEGLFPLSRAHDAPNEMEEERRLFYVGITRAKRKLFLSHARSRRRNGETMPSVPSSFLRSIPESLVEQRATIRLRATGRAVLPQSAAMRRPGEPVVRRSSRWDPDIDASQDAPRFVKGERVRHPRFGSGTVMELSGTGRETKVTVDFDDEEVGRKRLVVAYAGLERDWE